MYLYGKEPVDFLRQVAGRLRVGTALVLAAGEGRNAVFLAQQGFAVTAVDISGKGLEKCRALAAERGVTVHTAVADIDTDDIDTDDGGTVDEDTVEEWKKVTRISSDSGQSWSR